MTHADLVARAAKWLQGRRGCGIVVTELVSSTSEQPDALGYRGHLPMLVECKASVSDFRADAKKLFRRHPDKGMGYYRWYMVPAELAAKVEPELPERWGLLSVDGRGVRVVRDSGRFPTSDHRAEITVLSSLVRRIGMQAPKGVSIRVYTQQTKCKAELHVQDEEAAEAEESVEAGEAEEPVMRFYDAASADYYDARRAAIPGEAKAALAEARRRAELRRQAEDLGL